MRVSQESCILLEELVGTTELLWLRRNVLASETAEEGGEVSFLFVSLFVVFPAKPTISWRRKTNSFLKFRTGKITTGVKGSPLHTS